MYQACLLSLYLSLAFSCLARAKWGEIQTLDAMNEGDTKDYIKTTYRFWAICPESKPVLCRINPNLGILMLFKKNISSLILFFVFMASPADSARYPYSGY